MGDVLGSSIGPKTGYFDWQPSWFSSVSPRKCHDSILKQATTSSLHVLFNLTFIHHPFIRRKITRVAEKALLNKLEINIWTAL
jgi:hypothetical protein